MEKLKGFISPVAFIIAMLFRNPSNSFEISKDILSKKLKT